MSSHEVEGQDFRITKILRNSPVLIIAPHGGSIESGTTEIAKLVAGRSWSFYSFEGLKPGNNRILHVTSTKFDEPGAVSIIAAAQIVITIHGCREKEEMVILGGLHHKLKRTISDKLKLRGFIVDPDNSRKFPAEDQNNICNKGALGKGVQIELSAGLRNALKSNTNKMVSFINALKAAITPFCIN